MRKRMALLMAVLLIGSMALGVAATDEVETDAVTTPKLTTEYDVKSGTAPAESFGFTCTLKEYTDGFGETTDDFDDLTLPTVSISDATFADSAVSTTAYTSPANVNVTLNDCPLGYYTYEVKQTDNKTAGVTYNTTPISMVLTVYRTTGTTKAYKVVFRDASSDDEIEKIDSITNTYQAGSLEISKAITGNMAVTSTMFDFTVTFTPAAGTHFESVEDVQLANDDVRDYTYTSNNDGTVTVTFQLSNLHTANFTNIPVGTTYTISEDAQGYTASVTVDGETTEGSTTSGSIAASNEKDVVGFTNDLESPPATGIVLESVPYIVLLGAAVVGFGIMLTKKRSEG